MVSLIFYILRRGYVVVLSAEPDENLLLAGVDEELKEDSLLCNDTFKLVTIKRGLGTIRCYGDGILQHDVYIISIERDNMLRKI